MSFRYSVLWPTIWPRCHSGLSSSVVKFKFRGKNGAGHGTGFFVDRFVICVPCGVLTVPLPSRHFLFIPRGKYRRIAFGRPPTFPTPSPVTATGGLQIRDTAGCNPTLRAEACCFTPYRPLNFCPSIVRTSQPVLSVIIVTAPASRV
jgi:hypothetical protein